MANLQLTVNLGYLFCKALDGSAFSCRSIGTFGITVFFGPSRIAQAQCDIWSEKTHVFAFPSPNRHEKPCQML